MAEEKKINTSVIDEFNKDPNTMPKLNTLKFREMPEDMTVEKYISKISKAMYTAAKRNPEKYASFLNANDVDVVYFLNKMYEAKIYPDIVTPLLDLYNSLLKENWADYEDEDETRKMSEIQDVTYETNINITKTIAKLMTTLKLEHAEKNELLN